MKRTFKFTGSPDMKKNPYDEIMFFDPESGENVVLKKGQTFVTEHPTLVTELEEREDMEEVGADRADDKGKKIPPADNAKRT